jgi:predicted membrane channel-forming protein YqfA (hemolysin III family)
MDTPYTCLECGHEDCDGASYCTLCGSRMISPSGLRLEGWVMIVVAVGGLALAGWLLDLFFTSSRAHTAAGTVFIITLYAALAVMCLAVMAAGWYQAGHGRRNKFARVVAKCLPPRSSSR